MSMIISSCTKKWSTRRSSRQAILVRFVTLAWLLYPRSAKYSTYVGIQGWYGMCRKKSTFYSEVQSAEKLNSFVILANMRGIKSRNINSKTQDYDSGLQSHIWHESLNSRTWFWSSIPSMHREKNSPPSIRNVANLYITLVETKIDIQRVTVNSSFSIHGSSNQDG